MYGPLYPTLVAFVIKDPQSSFTAARVISSFALVGNCVVLGWWIARVSSPLVAVGASTFLLYQRLDASSWAFPMSLGTLLLVIPIAWVDTRGFNVNPAAVGGLMGAAAFMTKPYFVVVSVIMGLISLASLSCSKRADSFFRSLDLAMPLSSQRWTVKIYTRHGKCSHR